MKSSASATIAFGLVTVPVKLYLAASSEKFEFNLITPKNNRVTLVAQDVVTKEEVARENCKRGYEYEKGDYVIFEKADLDALQSEVSESIDLAEFVSSRHFDPKHVEKAYYLLPNKGAERSFRLLARALREEKRIGIGKYYAHGRDNLIALVPGEKEDSLTMYQLFYVNEVRALDYAFSTATEPDERTLGLARKLIKSNSSDELDLSAYADEYTERVRAHIEKKRAAGGEKVSAAAAEVVGKSKVVNLEELLSASLDKPKGKPRAKKNGKGK